MTLPGELGEIIKTAKGSVDAGFRLAAGCGGAVRTLYLLRHTYATLALLEGSADIHTLSKQMGNSAAMIERHYSKLTATMAADRLA